jgi:hypothetical protein
MLEFCFWYIEDKRVYKQFMSPCTSYIVTIKEVLNMVKDLVAL